MVKILMVCLGNICRSPLAEGILQSKLNADNFMVDSAGTADYHTGELPDRRSIKVAEEHAIDLTQQRARKVKASDFEIFDIIYAMDQSVYDDLVEMAENDQQKQKVRLILDEVFPNEHMDVPDPYYESDYAFRNVYNMLDEACSVIAENLD